MIKSFEHTTLGVPIHCYPGPSCIPRRCWHESHPARASSGRLHRAAVLPPPHRACFTIIKVCLSKERPAATLPGSTHDKLCLSHQNATPGGRRGPPVPCRAPAPAAAEDDNRRGPSPLEAPFEALRISRLAGPFRTRAPAGDALGFNETSPAFAPTSPPKGADGGAVCRLPAPQRPRTTSARDRALLKPPSKPLELAD